MRDSFCGAGAGGNIERVRVGESTAFLVEDRSLPLVHFAFGLRYGAWADPEGQAGLTGLLFELMGRGTHKRDRLGFCEALERMGTTLTPMIGDEIALFRGTCLKRFLKPSLELVVEQLTEPSLDGGELSRLVEECQEELQNERDDDEALVGHFLRQALYGDHLLGRNPGGTLETLGAMSTDDLNRAFRGRFHASGQLWFFGGDFDRDVVLDVVDQVGSRGGGERLELAVTPIARPALPRILLVDKPDRTQVQARVAAPVLEGGHPDTLLFWLGAVAFGGTFTSPFTREVRDVRGWSYFASAGFQRRRRNTASLVLSTASAVEDAVDCLELQVSLLNEFARSGTSADEIERSKSYLLNRYPFTIATPGELLVPVFQNEVIGESERELFEFPEKLKELEPEQVCRSVSEHLKPDSYVAVLVGTAARFEETLRRRFPNAELVVADYRDGL